MSSFRSLRNLLLVALAAGPASALAGEAAAPAAQPAAQAAQPRINFNALVQQIRQQRERETQENQRREQAFRAEQQRIEGQAREALARRNAAEQRSNELDRRWQANEQRIAELTELLRQHEGNLGELFGVTRQVAGDAANVLQQSMLSAQFKAPEGSEGRREFMTRIAGARALPSITELERLWFELHREMTEGAKVARFSTTVLGTDPSTGSEQEVVRIGPFTAVGEGGQYLAYLPANESLSVMSRQLLGELRGIARDLFGASGDAYTKAVVDPARGALLGMYVERPNWVERITEGEAVVYVIVFVGILGTLLAIIQALYLIITRLKVAAQLRNIDRPTPNNPLGRVLLAFRSGSGRIQNAEIAELRISEAVLKEVPRLERFQGFLRLAVAAGPLLGLVGTVIGMIITFHAITVSGSSDPKLMAHGIGQAMIATVMGLGIAIPLLFINAGLTTLSRGVTQILDEQSHTMLAESISGGQ